MNKTDLHETLRDLSLQWVHITNYLTVYEMHALMVEASAYGITEEDIQVFTETDMIPERLIND